jgi:hypothetical protein
VVSELPGRQQVPNPTSLQKRNVVTPYLSRKGTRAARRADGGAGLGCRKKRTPSCNGADTGLNVTRHESEPTSDGSFSAREQAEASRKGRGQSEATAQPDAGALPTWREDWHAINWRKIYPKVRRLQVRIAEAVRATQQPGRAIGLQKGLSRMRGNSHVRFLEGLGGRKAPWPTRRRTTHAYEKSS